MRESSTAVDEVVQSLMSAIAGGTWAEGERISTERALTAELAASRATVRAAVARLIEWGVLVAQQGSGTYVQPRRHWRLGALPSMLEALMTLGRVDEVVAILQDGLEFRRGLVLDLLERASNRVRGRNLDAMRAAAASAWEARDDMPTFLRRDHAFLIHLVDAADMTYSAWMLNDIRRTYESVVTSLAVEAQLPDSYLKLHLATVDALENGDGARAKATFERFLADLDAQLASALPDAFARRLRPDAEGAEETQKTQKF